MARAERGLILDCGVRAGLLREVMTCVVLQAGGEMGSDHDFRLHSSYGRGLARDQAFVAKRRLIAGEPARAALSEAFR